MSEDEALSETFRFADVVFRKLAAGTAASDGVTFEEAHRETWQLYELGYLKLVGEGDRLSVRACIARADRRAAAKQNQLLAAYWRRTIFAARGRTEREQGSQPEPNNPSTLTRSGRLDRVTIHELPPGDMA